MTCSNSWMKMMKVVILFLLDSDAYFWCTGDLEGLGSQGALDFAFSHQQMDPSRRKVFQSYFSVCISAMCYQSVEINLVHRLCTDFQYFSYCFYQQLEEKGLESKNRGGSQSISWTKSFSLSVVGNGKNTKSKLIWFSLSPIFSHPIFHSPKFFTRSILFTQINLAA